MYCRPVAHSDAGASGPARSRTVAAWSQILDELFPGFLTELVADGCTVWDDGDFSKYCLSFGGHQLFARGPCVVFNRAIQPIALAARL